MSSTSPLGYKTGEILNEKFESRYPTECPMDTCEIMNGDCSSTDLTYQNQENYYCDQNNIDADYDMTTHPGKTWDECIQLCKDLDVDPITKENKCVGI